MGQLQDLGAKGSLRVHWVNQGCWYLTGVGNRAKKRLVFLLALPATNSRGLMDRVRRVKTRFGASFDVRLWRGLLSYGRVRHVHNLGFCVIHPLLA